MFPFLFPSVGAFFRRLSVFLIYFYCFLMISICFPADFMAFIFKNPRNSMTSAKRSNVQTKPNQHILADGFRISELVTLALGFARAALGDYIHDTTILYPRYYYTISTILLYYIHDTTLLYPRYYFTIPTILYPRYYTIQRFYWRRNPGALICHRPRENQR